MTTLLISSTVDQIAPFLAKISAFFALITAIIALVTFIKGRKAKKEEMDYGSYIEWQEKEKAKKENTEKYRNNPTFINISFKIHEGVIRDYNDLYDVYRGIELKDYKSFHGFLLDYNYWLTFADSITKDNKIIDSSGVLDIKKIISRVLKEEQDKKLFIGVDKDDRSCLLAIHSYINGCPNQYKITRELELLSFSLLRKQKDLKYQLIMNASALLTSIFGIVATAFFSMSTDSKVSNGFEDLKIETLKMQNSIDSISKSIDKIPVLTNISSTKNKD